MEGKTTYLWLGLGCFALMLVGGLACGGFWLLSPTMFAAPEEVDVRVDSPLHVPHGEDFEIRVEVTNNGTKPVSIHSIEITDRYGDGVAVTDATPLWSTSEHDGLNKLQWYNFDHEVAGNSAEVIVIHANALYEGDWGGDLHVCINSQLNYTSHPIRTVIQVPAPAGVVGGVVGGLGTSTPAGEPATPAPSPVEATWQ